MPDHQQTFVQISDAINGAKEILLIAHQKPDGDTLGANLAMANWLRDTGKHFHIFCLHPVPPHFQYLPLWQHVKSTEDELEHIPFDVVITIDSSTLSKLEATEKNSKFWIGQAKKLLTLLSV